VCIIGENGCGKTTLLKLLLGEIEPDGGTVRLGSQVVIGYLPRQVDFEDENQTVLEYFSRLHNLTYGEARSQLAKVLFFNEDVNKSIKFLSGGEKSRLKLCSLTYEGVNLLILDEPTNHLDIESREVLEQTLLNFSGTLFFVSHDRYFIDKIADKIIEIENLTTKEYNGDFTYYQDEVKKMQEKQVVLQYDLVKLQDRNYKFCGSKSNTFSEPKNANLENAYTKNAYAKNTNSKNTKKLELLEQRIEEMEEKIRSLEILIEANCSDCVTLKELFEEKEKASKELDKAYTEWYNHE